MSLVANYSSSDSENEEENDENTTAKSHLEKNAESTHSAKLKTSIQSNGNQQNENSFDDDVNSLLKGEKVVMICNKLLLSVFK